MTKKQFISYNLSFHLPFLLWVIIGGFTMRSFDKLALFSSINTVYSPTADKLMYYVTSMGQAEIIIPVLLLLMIVPAYRNWWYFTTALLCNVIPFFIQHFIKSWLNYPRPQLLLHDKALIHFLPEWPVLLHSSFPSGHSQGAFSFFCFLALITPPKYRAYGLLYFMLAMAVGYSRIYLAAHFFEDVYVGSIFGTVITTLIFSIMMQCRGFFFKTKNALA